MAQTKIKQNQFLPSTTPGSLITSDASNVFVINAPATGSDKIPFYDDSATAIAYLTLGTNLSISGTTLNATAGAGGYATVQEEGSTVGASNTTINFIGSGITAADAGSGVTSVTMNTFLNTLATAGNINLATVVTGTLPVANGGTGAITLTGLLQGNGTSAITAIPNSSTVGQVLRVTGASTYAWGALDLADTDAVTGVLPAINGGTGQSSYAVGDILYASTTTALSKLADVATGNALISGGVGVAPSYGKIGLTTHVSGILPIANGGTGSGTQNFVDLSTTQTIGGDKTFSNNVILNGTASLDSHAVNLGVLKTYITGMDGKQSVRVATTANGTLATAYENGDTIDGVVLATNDRILLKDQTAQAENGIYVVQASGAPVRATDMDAWTEVPGSYVAVEEGTTNADTVWLCTANQGGTLGTTAIVWSKWKAAGAGVDGSGNTNKVAYWSDTDTLTSTTNFHYNGTQLAVGTATPVTSAVFTTQGTGTGSGTYGYQHNNSSSTLVFRVADDGTLKVGATDTLTINNTSITTGAAVNLTIAGGSSVILQSGGSTNTATNAVMDASRNFTSGSGINLGVTGTFNPTSGTGTYIFADINTTINQTGGANGITRGLYIHPTLTAAADFRALEITANSSHYALWSTAGKVRHDLGSDATGDTWYRGAGGEMVRLPAGATSGHVLTSNGSAAAPSWQAAAGGVTVTRAYKTGATTDTFDLDSGTAVTDIDGTNVTFTTSGISADKIFVVRNGVTLSQSGTVSRDYTLNTGTGVLVLAYAMTSDESLMVYKIV